MARLTKRQALRRWSRLLRWLQGVGLWQKFEVAMFVLAPVFLIATLTALSMKSGPTGVASGTVRALLLADMVLLLALAALVGLRLARVWAARRSGLAGSRLLGRMVGFFSLFAVAPAIILAIFSAFILQFGIESWFSEKVRSALDNSLVVAESYLEEHRRGIQADIRAMASDLNTQALYVQQNRRLLQILVDDQTAKRALSEALVFNSAGKVLARSTLNLDLAPKGVPQTVLAMAQTGEMVMISSAEDDRVGAVLKLNGFFETYLYVSRFVDTRVLGHVEGARSAVAEYQNMEGQRSVIQFGFTGVYFVSALLILMFAVWAGLSFATRIVRPIGELVDATGRISKGDLKVRVPSLTSDDELGSLSRAFNRMTRELSNQQEALIETNNMLDDRRRFTEAVLSGVSAGVIGLDPEFRVNLPNRSACAFLEDSSAALIGRDIRVVMPEVGTLLDLLAVQPEDPVRDQISIARSGTTRTLLVRIAAETDENAVTGYVLTFDDITDQLADQRTAAWADVARRIAHEIKNPLTPIQLAAERLQRKYADEITTMPEVFNQCTDTIIRQVGDLRRMVDEFSSFARMPTPIFRAEDLNDIVRQAVFLQEVARPDIEFSLDAPKGGCRLTCDGRLVAQAVTNLLKNATESISSHLAEDAGNDLSEGGRIKAFVVESTDGVAISVEDNGSGLSPDIAERLTEPYVTSRAKGTGLGLAIVRKIMEDHGGQLAMRNGDTEGAVATLSFDRRSLKVKELAIDSGSKKHAAAE